MFVEENGKPCPSWCVGQRGEKIEFQDVKASRRLVFTRAPQIGSGKHVVHVR
jgi:hypothetical protein